MNSKSNLIEIQILILNMVIWACFFFAFWSDGITETKEWDENWEDWTEAFSFVLIAGLVAPVIFFQQGQKAKLINAIIGAQLTPAFLIAIALLVRALNPALPDSPRDFLGMFCIKGIVLIDILSVASVFAGRYHKDQKGIPHN